MIARDGAIAGINGDFYDIGDTGAPLGLGVDRERGLLHARKSGWNRAFLIKDGVPTIANLPMKAKVVQEPWMKIRTTTRPRSSTAGSAIYDYRWGNDGRLPRRRRPDRGRPPGRDPGQPRRLQQAHPDLRRAGPRAGARRPRHRRRRPRRAEEGRQGPRDVGACAATPRSPSPATRCCCSHGVRRVVDDLEMHPRTAIGIDRDTGQVLMLVVDGRQSFSRGYTMVELANLMTALGAEDALNLDGGGSSTMLAPDPNGVDRRAQLPVRRLRAPRRQRPRGQLHAVSALAEAAAPDQPVHGSGRHRHDRDAGDRREALLQRAGRPSAA